MKTIKVHTHIRNGSIIPEHDRTIESKGEPLAERIKRRAADKAKSKTLFGEDQNDIT